MESNKDKSQTVLAVAISLVWSAGKEMRTREQKNKKATAERKCKSFSEYYVSYGKGSLCHLGIGKVCAVVAAGKHLDKNFTNV